MGKTGDQIETVFEEETPAVPEAPTAPGTRLVAYVGQASVREITSSQWAGAGVEGMGDTLWTIENRHLLPLEEFTPEALEILFKDGQFRVVDVKSIS